MTVDMVVTHTPTSVWGLVVKWWPAAWVNAGDPGAAPLVSASRDGVMIHGYLHEVSHQVLDTAKMVAGLLVGGKADLAAAAAPATHRYDRGAMRLVAL